METENKPAENVTEAASPAASDKSAARWRLIMLVLCAVGAGLVVGIMALQVTEYLFYKAAPNVWPHSGTVSAPAAVSVPLVPVTTTTSSAAPTTSTGLMPTPALTNAPVVAKP